MDYIIDEKKGSNGLQDTGFKDWAKEKINLKERALDSLFNIIPLVSNKFHSCINKIEKAKPNDAQCEFSLGFDVEGNLILAKASLNAQFKIRLGWNNL